MKLVIRSSKRNIVGLAMFAALLVALAVAAFPVRGQLAGANLSGVVTDESGAAVASAKVSIKNLSTGDVRDVTTNTDGLYSAPNLLPGSYEVTVTAKGFSTTVQKGITLTVGAEQALNFGKPSPLARRHPRSTPQVRPWAQQSSSRRSSNSR